MGTLAAGRPALGTAGVPTWAGAGGVALDELVMARTQAAATTRVTGTAATWTTRRRPPPSHRRLIGSRRSSGTRPERGAADRPLGHRRRRRHGGPTAAP